MKTQKLSVLKKDKAVKVIAKQQLKKVQGGMPYELEGSIVEDEIGGFIVSEDGDFLVSANFIITEELDGF